MSIESGPKLKKGVDFLLKANAYLSLQWIGAWTRSSLSVRYDSALQRLSLRRQSFYTTLALAKKLMLSLIREETLVVAEIVDRTTGRVMA